MTSGPAVEYDSDSLLRRGSSIEVESVSSFASRRTAATAASPGAGDQAARASRGRAARSYESISGPPRYGRLGGVCRAAERRGQLFLRLFLVGPLLGVGFGSPIC